MPEYFRDGRQGIQNPYRCPYQRNASYAQLNREDAEQKSTPPGLARFHHPETHRGGFPPPHRERGRNHDDDDLVIESIGPMGDESTPRLVRPPIGGNLRRSGDQTRIATAKGAHPCRIGEDDKKEAPDLPKLRRWKSMAAWVNTKSAIPP